MHGMSETGSTVVPAFLSKLLTLVDDPSTDDVICWDLNGQSFHVLDQNRLAKEVLPLYFKHNNFASFVRQLNMYGFRKKVHAEAGSLKVETDDMEFQHSYFIRDHPELLEYIKRKVTGSSTKDELRVKQDDVSRVLGDVKQLKGKQDNLNNKLDTLKRENEALWREVANLRSKHSKQQQVVNKLIQFLLSLVSTNRSMGPSLKRKLPMLNDSSHLEATKPKFSRQLSIDHREHTSLGPNGTNQMSSMGPTIHDVTDSQELAPGEAFIIQDANTSAPEITEPSSVEAILPEPDSLSMEEVSDLGNIPVKQEPPARQILKATRRRSSGKGRNLEPLIMPQQQQPVVIMEEQPQPAPAAINLEDLVDQPGTSTGTTDTAQISGTLPGSLVLPENQTALNVGDLGEHVEFLDSDLDSIKRLLTSGTLNLDANTLTGLFTSELPLPVDLDNLLDMETDKAPFPNPETQPSGNIVGNEVIQYAPSDGDILSLFDLQDLGDENMATLNTGDITKEAAPEEEQIDTPNMVPATPNLVLRKSARPGGQVGRGQVD